MTCHFVSCSVCSCFILVEGFCLHCFLYVWAHQTYTVILAYCLCFNVCQPEQIQILKNREAIIGAGIQCLMVLSSALCVSSKS